jgi:ATP-binding protein involved in chromosome partitioning
LTIEKDLITVEISSTNPALHARKRMEEAVVFRLQRELRLKTEVHCIVRAMKGEERNARRSVLPDVKHIIAIASGKGGVGKSTLTANLAVGLAAEGYTVGLIDADIYGPSMPTMFDVQGQRPHLTSVGEKSLIEPISNHGVKLLSIGFFTDQDNAVVWRGPMASKALTQMITEGNWGVLDFLLIDLPPGTGDIHLSLAQTLPLDGVVIVSTPQEVALADARRGINMFSIEGLNVPIVGIVENMAWFTPAELPENRYYLFGRDGAKNLAHGLNIPFLGAIPLVQSIREAGDVGRPAVLQKASPIGIAFTDLVRTFVKELASIKNKK